MTSWLIDLVLLAALGFTAWRTSVMVGELRRLRGENSSFRQMLVEADSAIDRAAHAVVSFKSEGMRTLRDLEKTTEEARRQAERLDYAIRSADLRFALAERSEAA
jgi:hypothetical protein